MKEMSYRHSHSEGKPRTKPSALCRNGLVLPSAQLGLPLAFREQLVGAFIFPVWDLHHIVTKWRAGWLTRAGTVRTCSPRDVQLLFLLIGLLALFLLGVFLLFWALKKRSRITRYDPNLGNRSSPTAVLADRGRTPSSLLRVPRSQNLIHRNPMGPSLRNWTAPVICANRVLSKRQRRQPNDRHASVLCVTRL